MNSQNATNNYFSVRYLFQNTKPSTTTLLDPARARVPCHGKGVNNDRCQPGNCFFELHQVNLASAGNNILPFGNNTAHGGR